MENNNNQEINIELNDDIASGIFSNLALINHAPTEFVVDFIQMMPGVPKAKVKSRIILTPQHAKKFLRAMAENIHKYESQFGEIVDLETFNGTPLNFGTPAEA